MVRLAANYSASLVDLLREDGNCVDAVKVSEFFLPKHMGLYSSMPVRKPLVLHGLCQDTSQGRAPSLGMIGFRESVSMRKIEEVVEFTGSSYLSSHLEYHALSHPGASDFLGQLERDVAFVVDGMGLPLHLENTYHGSPGKDGLINATYVDDPAFVKEALLRTGTRFLLDIAHAQCAAWQKRLSAKEYMKRLPLSMASEVHVNGAGMVDGELRDRHLPMTPESYYLLEYALDRAEIHTVSLEFGGIGPMFLGRDDKEALGHQLERLSSILGR